jgi:hypothetical protein
LAIKAIKARLKLGLKGGLRGGVMGRSGNGSTVSRSAERAARGAVGKTDPTGGVHASTRGEREGVDDGRRESKKKTYFAKYAKAGAG